MGEWIEDPTQSSGWRYDDDTPKPDEPPPAEEPPSRTAGQQDHTDPWIYAGETADPPEEP